MEKKSLSKIPLNTPIYLTVSFGLDEGVEYKNSIAVKVVSTNLEVGTINTVLLGVQDENSSDIEILFLDANGEYIDTTKQECPQVFMSTDILKWHPIKDIEIPLMINWFFLSDSFKKQFFGV